jgi:Amt family ammonium transporter
MTLNGALVGVVAICAGCDKYNIGSAFIIGFFAALTYMGISKLMLICKLDDPLDAVAVHAGGGL